MQARCDSDINFELPAIAISELWYLIVAHLFRHSFGKFPCQRSRAISSLRRLGMRIQRTFMARMALFVAFASLWWRGWQH